jgi:crotonobetainyl-CoA:carnitine CoA-transferase CaiB-like acyl-CoA transferase
VVSTSLLANGLWSMGCYLQAALCDATFRPRTERYHRSSLLEVYRCRDDRWFMFSMVNQVREWPLLLACIERPEWENDPRFESPAARMANSADLTHALEAIFAKRDWPEWRERFMEHGVTFGPIAEPQDHIECPQVAANGLLPAFAGDIGLRTIDSPIRLEGEAKTAPRMAPRIGEHSRVILEELGLTDAEIGHMSDTGVIAIAE